MSNLFDVSYEKEPGREAPRPLADQLRPKTLAEVMGQDHLLKGDGALAQMGSAALRWFAGWWQIVHLGAVILVLALQIGPIRQIQPTAPLGHLGLEAIETQREQLLIVDRKVGIPRGHVALGLDDAALQQRFLLISK